MAPSESGRSSSTETPERRAGDPLFEGIVSLSADAIIATNANLRVDLFNDAAEQLFGYPRDEVLGRDLSMLLPERFRVIHDEHVRAFASGPVGTRRMGQRAAIVGRRKGGEEFPAEASISKLEVDGRTVLVVAIRDISERQRAAEEREQLLRQIKSEHAWLRTVIETAPMGILVFDRSGRVQANRRAEALMGLTIDPEKGSGQYLGRICLPDGTPLPREELASTRVLTRGEEFAAEELLIVRPDGTRVPILVSAAPVRDVSGDGLGGVVLFEDITEHKRRASDQLFLARVGELLLSAVDDQEMLSGVARLVVEYVADWCVLDVVDGDGNLLLYREVATADPSQQHVAEQLRRRQPEPAKPRLLLRLTEARRSELQTEVTREHLAALAEDEEHRRLFAQINPQSYVAIPLIARQRVLGAEILLSADPERRFDERDMALAEELAHRIAIAVDNIGLYRAAQRATRARDEVLGTVAHDLRNPLNSIALSAKMLQHAQRRGRELDPHGLEHMVRAADRMNRMIEDLLDVAQLDAGTLAITPRRYSAKRLVADAIEAQRSQAGDRTLASDVDEGAGDVMVDLDRGLRVLSNLIGNAVKFTGDDGRITVGASPAGREVRFRVVDDGPGIPHEEQAHLFERFWQGDRRDRRGAGLGLSIVMQLVEAHGGRVWVESAPGVGTTFFFTLPAARG